MGSADHKKAKRRKNKKTTKLSTPSKVLQPLQVASTTSSEPPPPKPEYVQQKDLEEIQRLMDAEDDSEPPSAPFSKGPNPYLGGDRCLLCHCERPEEARLAAEDGEEEEDEADKNDSQEVEVGAMSLPLWVCQECRKTVEEEEKKAASMPSNILEQDLRIDPASLSLITELTPASEPATPNGTMCTCDACIERRQIEVESEKENQDLQKNWMELRHIVRCLYRQSGTDVPGSENLLPNEDSIRDLVHRLVVRDPHLLFQRLETQAQDYVIEVKVRLLKQMSTGLKTPQQARQFVSMLLEEYANLCKAAKTMAFYLTDLQEHLKRFNLTWELHNKHLFHSTIYSDPMLLNKLPLLMAHLRFGSKEGEEDPYTSVLHGYCKFDDEMSVISVVWRDCYQLIDNYNDEQTAMKAKQKMLKEDWEFFKAQRKLLEQQVLKNKSANTSTHSLETQFTETMRHILQGTKPSAEECICPNCNRKRCPCDECSISHMITCGIINPEVADPAAGHHNPLLFTQDPTRYIIDVTPPSMSSTSSSSGSESPITVEPEKITLPFDELAEEIPEEIEIQYGDSDDDSTMEDARKEERGAGDGADNTDECSQAHAHKNLVDADYDEDDDEDDDDEDDEDDDDDEEDDEIDDDEDDEDDEDDDDEDDEDDEDEDDEEEEEDEEGDNEEQILSSVAQGTISFPTLGMQATGENAKSENCDCNHCTLQAKLEQAKSLEDSQNQCQCHACLQQSGKTLATSLPQHLPATPRPAALHLYPHIHGSNTIHPGLHGGHSAAAQLRPILQPHLYQLHNPLGLPTKSVSQTSPSQSQDNKVPQATSTAFSLDLESRDSLSEHLYHTFPEWDSSMYDPSKLILNTHKLEGSLGSELFNAPTPPLLTGAQFVADLSSVGVSLDNSLANVVKTSTILQQLPSTSKPLTTTTVTTATGLVTSLGGAVNDVSHGCVSSTSSETYLKSLKPISHSLFTQALNAQAHALGSQAHVVASSAGTPGHMVGASQDGVLGKSAVLVPSSTFGSLATTMVSSVALGTSACVPATNTTGALGAPQSDFCQKHNSFLHSQPFAAAAALGSQALGVGSQAPQPLLNPHASSPMKLNTDRCSAAAKEEAIKALGAQNLSMFNLPRTCNLPSNLPLAAASNTLVQLAAASGSKALPTMTIPTAMPASHATTVGVATTGPTSTRPYATKAGLDPNVAAAQIAATNNNVSVGTSTLCQDGECEGHVADDNYDSIDDSCSEQSSSTSTSNQKDGKYCDCCYCEFFGHTTSQTLPTSRNFTEMREKLRLKLKKKNEAKTTDPVPMKHEEEEPTPTQHDLMEQKGLDELLRYINGSDADKKVKAELKQSAKAAKRARQKQRKAEEKVKKEAEDRARREKEERAALEAANLKRCANAAQHSSKTSFDPKTQNATQQQQQMQQKKKKSKHKEEAEVTKAESLSLATPQHKAKSATSSSGSTHGSTSGGHHPVTIQSRVTASHTATAGNKSKHLTTSHQTLAPKTTTSSTLQNETAKSGKSVQTKGSADAGQSKGASHHPTKPLISAKMEAKGMEMNMNKMPSSVCMESLKNDRRKRTKQQNVSVISHQSTSQATSNSANKQQQAGEKSNQQRFQALLDNLKSPPRSMGQDAVIAKNNQRNLQQHQAVSKSQSQTTKNSNQPLAHQRGGAAVQNGNHKVAHTQTTSTAVTNNNNNHHITAGGKGASQDYHATSCSKTSSHHLHGSTQPPQQQQQNKRKGKKVPANQQPVQQAHLPPASQPAPAQHNSHQQSHKSQPSTPVKQQPINHQHPNANPREPQASHPTKGHGKDTNDRMMNGGTIPVKAQEKKGRNNPGPDKSRQDERQSRSQEQGSSGKSKKNKRKNKPVEDLDEIFMPKDDTENGDLDEYEREIEEFKRFCMDSTPVAKREKLQVNVNLKDIFSKKKSGLGCA